MRGRLVPTADSTTPIVCMAKTEGASRALTIGNRTQERVVGGPSSVIQTQQRPDWQGRERQSDHDSTIRPRTGTTPSSNLGGDTGPFLDYWMNLAESRSLVEADTVEPGHNDDASSSTDRSETTSEGMEMAFPSSWQSPVEGLSSFNESQPKDVPPDRNFAKSSPRRSQGQSAALETPVSIAGNAILPQRSCPDNTDPLRMLANSPGRLIVAEDGSQRYFGSSSNIAMLHDWSSSMFRPSIRCVLKDGNHAIQQAGLEWPDDPEQEEWLTKQYFTWHNPLSHEVIEHDYMAAKAAFNSGEATELYSPALRNAIQQNGAHASLKHQEPAEFFALRARVYLDVEMDSPCLATAQSTLLLAAYEFGRGLDSRGWVYAGMNIHLLIDLGLCPDLSRGQRVAGPGYQSDALQRSRSELFRASFSSNMLWAMYTGRPSLLSKLAVDRGNKHILTKTDELLWENFQRQGLDSLRDLEAQSRAMGIPHYLYQLLRIMEAIRASPQHGMRDADDTTPEIFINTMSKVLDDWMTSLPKPLRVDTVEMDHDQEIATSKHASAILLLQ
ncbi:hypothetical protein AYO22_01254 [Fonsecaea multimorphosa]|nr:hypothetical protein AYO22_01254 [Fonsecaea multimorphosa]